MILVCPISKNIPFWSILSSYKTDDDIYFHTPSNLKAYQPYINFLFLTNNSPCITMVNIYAF